MDRWQELESQASKPPPALPDFTNPAEAARAWALQYEQTQKLGVEVTRLVPLAEGMDPDHPLGE